MFNLLKNSHVYAPEDLGAKDILPWEDRIIKIGEELKIPEGFDGAERDLSGRIIIPGLVDTHVHITGGGGNHTQRQNGLGTEHGRGKIIACFNESSHSPRR